MSISETGKDRETMKLSNDQIADRIYSHYFGHLDDKRFCATKTQEILDWLNEGDPEGLTLKSAIHDWGEYDAEEVKLQRSPAANLGAMTSEKKAASSRENGKRGGRGHKASR